MDLIGFLKDLIGFLEDLIGPMDPWGPAHGARKEPMGTKSCRDRKETYQILNEALIEPGPRSFVVGPGTRAWTPEFCRGTWAP